VRCPPQASNGRGTEEEECGSGCFGRPSNLRSLRGQYRLDGRSDAFMEEAAAAAARRAARDGAKWLSSPSTASQLGGGASPMIARWLLQDHCSGASRIPARTGFQDDIPRIREEMRVPIDRQTQL
jgi:hypothetical protein